MQGAIFQQLEITEVQPQASRVLPDHGAGAQDQAINDDVYHDENSPFRTVLSVLGNVIGGGLLLYGMFVLPHLVAGLLS